MVAWSQSPEEGWVKRLFQLYGVELENKGKILNIQHKRSTAQVTNGVGETPLNGKGVLFHY